MRFTHIFELAKPHKKILLTCLTLLLLEAGLVLSIPFFIGKLAGGVFSGFSENLSLIVLVLICLFTLQAAVQIIRGVFMAKSYEAILASIRTNFYTHIQLLPLSFFLNRKTGNVMSLINYDAYILSNYIGNTLLNFIPLLFMIIGASTLMLLIEPSFAVLMIICIPLNIVVMQLFGRKIRGLSIEVQQANADGNAMLEESFTNIKTVKSYVQETAESERFGQKMTRVSQLTAKLVGSNAILRPIVQWLTILLVITFIWMSSDSFSDQTMRLSEMVSFIIYAVVLTRPISGIVQVWGQTNLVEGILSRMEAIYAIPIENYEGGHKLSHIDGDIEFRNVCLGYTHRSPVLINASLKINAGETIALIGANGVGKSSLINILLRFIEPQSGDVLLDGHSIKQINLQTLRQNIGLVSQDPYLFSDSLKANITYGRKAVTSSEISKVIKQAQLQSFVENCPQGLDTLIGDKGIKLSGGEKQKLALARALLSAPKILVLDEPTAMFDPESEHAFVKNIKQVFKNKTVILVTHHPKTLALADRVIRLRGGRIEQCDKSKFAEII